MTPEFSSSGLSVPVCPSSVSGAGRLGPSSRYPASSSGGGSSPSSAPPVRVSFLGNMMTFNFGRELLVYPYNNGSMLDKPLDKRVYKGTCPTSHDFSEETDGQDEDSSSLSLLVGFSGGQIQLLDPLIKELSQLYNEDRFVDKTRVTRVKWLPGTRELFLCSHASGNIYVYNRDLPCQLTPPSYVLLKKGLGFSVHVQSKPGKGQPTPKNPIVKWTVGKGSINEFAFSPCGNYLAVVGQDGYLRIFNYDAMELVGTARSYFGGLLCVSWAPDGKYIVCGGEDDLVTVYSFLEKRVVVRGQGHKSWVSVVAFDPFNMSFGEVPDGFDGSASEEDREEDLEDARRRSSPQAESSSGGNNVTCYRFGSVGQDTYICLWDITEDILKGPPPVLGGPHGNDPQKSNTSSPNSSLGALTNASFSVCSKDSGLLTDSSSSSATNNSSSSNNHSSSLSHRLASLNFGDRKDRKGSGSKNSSRSSSASLPGSSIGTASSSSSERYPEESVKLGSQQCPRIYEIPLIEPLVVKKVAHERLTALVFREEYLVTACQDGYVRTWARPGKMTGGNPSALCPGSPPISNSNSLSSSTCCSSSNNTNNNNVNNNSISHSAVSGNANHPSPPDSSGTIV